MLLIKQETQLNLNSVISLVPLPVHGFIGMDNAELLVVILIVEELIQSVKLSASSLVQKVNSFIITKPAHPHVLLL